MGLHYNRDLSGISGSDFNVFLGGLFTVEP